MQNEAWLSKVCWVAYVVWRSESRKSGTTSKLAVNKKIDFSGKVVQQGIFIVLTVSSFKNK